MNQNEKAKIVGELYKDVDKVNDRYFDFWKEHTLLHWDWWVSLGLTIIPWVIWWEFRDKQNTARFMFSAFFIIITTCLLDFFGVVSGFWYYTGKVIPSIPSYFPWDFCLFPVSMTLLMQYRPYISPVKKSIFYSGIVSFVGEPFFDRIGFYTMVHWEYIYSFPIYIIIYLCADWVSKRKTFGTVSK
ncbi:CBO0543 family protein [Bacillus sp. T3]|uniref:CBO0543 family protein n=1 Tax=Bacillus sp. T3 TaxID=467262 RepID=UPI002981571F|nr:CBO0543 family protein [Bacillus sp. T3]